MRNNLLQLDNYEKYPYLAIAFNIKLHKIIILNCIYLL